VEAMTLATMKDLYVHNNAKLEDFCYNSTISGCWNINHV